MLIIIASITAVGVALAFVLNQLRKAPVGYEDELGFHIVRHVKGSGVIHHSEQDATVRAALKAARAHS